jgi:hypothetical protein
MVMLCEVGDSLKKGTGRVPTHRSLLVSAEATSFLSYLKVQLLWMGFLFFFSFVFAVPGIERQTVHMVSTAGLNSQP